MSFSLNVEWKEISSCHCSSVLLWLYMVYTPTLDELCAFPVLFLSLDPAVCKKLTRYYAQGTRQSWGKDAGKVHGKQNEKLNTVSWTGGQNWEFGMELLSETFKCFQAWPGTSESRQCFWSLKQLVQWRWDWWNLEKKKKKGEISLKRSSSASRKAATS